MQCCGAECDDGAVYATEGYGFICVPRNITDRLVKMNRVFSEADAWLDLWCHTTYKDLGNAFSFLCPVIQYGRYGSLLSMDYLGSRWGWERTKVWRFFQNNACTFGLHRMPGAFGSLIFNLAYFEDDRVTMPSDGKILYLLVKIREASRKGIKADSDRNKVNRMIAWNSGKVIASQYEKPDAPHTVVTAADGSQWYQMASGEGRGVFYDAPIFGGSDVSHGASTNDTPGYSGGYAEAPLVAATFPDAEEGTMLRTVGEGMIEASSPDGGNTLWYNSAFYQEPDAPHSVMEAANVVQWYAMQQQAQAPEFESGAEAAQYNQAAFQSFMPGYDGQVSQVDGSHRQDGHFEVRNADGSGTVFYDTARYAARHYKACLLQHIMVHSAPKCIPHVGLHSVVSSS